MNYKKWIVNVFLFVTTKVLRLYVIVVLFKGNALNTLRAFKHLVNLIKRENIIVWSVKTTKKKKSLTSALQVPTRSLSAGKKITNIQNVKTLIPNRIHKIKTTLVFAIIYIGTHRQSGMSRYVHNIAHKTETVFELWKLRFV